MSGSWCWSRNKRARAYGTFGDNPGKTTRTQRYTWLPHSRITPAAHTWPLRKCKEREYRRRHHLYMSANQRVFFFPWFFWDLSKPRYLIITRTCFDNRAEKEITGGTEVEMENPAGFLSFRLYRFELSQPVTGRSPRTAKETQLVNKKSVAYNVARLPLAAVLSCSVVPTRRRPVVSISLAKLIQQLPLT